MSGALFSRTFALMLDRLRSRRRWRNHYQDRSLAETFDYVYARGLWGVDPVKGVHSGSGSRGDLLAQYCNLIVPELTRGGIRSIVDIGCGDFQAGAVLARAVGDYTGVDVSEVAIAANQIHASPRCRFLRADATIDPLPPGDAAVLKQVLQHLSNAQILQVLANVLSTYPTVFITEDLHADSARQPNLDMIHGPHTRVPERSGVRIDLPPFSVPAAVLGDTWYSETGFIRTWVARRS